MAEEGLDERYLRWLYSRVANVKLKVRHRTYWNLLTQMHDTIFVAVVPFDENRIEDAKDLRYTFLAETEEEAGDPEWTRSPASVLEVFIVLSDELAFEMDDDISVWFWHLIGVLELEHFNDRAYDEQAQEAISEALDRVIWRRYEPDGRGGLFPLRNAQQDQRKVELWYQLNAYLLEQF